MSDCNIVKLVNWFVEQSLPTQADFIKRNSEVITKFVRQHKLEKNPSNDFLISKIADVVVGLLSVPASPFLSEQLMALLNNIFNLDCRFIQKVLTIGSLLKNIREYCISFFKKYQNFVDTEATDCEPSKMYFNLYSAVYLLAIFASHKPISDQQTAGIKIVLHKSLIRQFLRVEFQQHTKPELFFLFSVIMVRVTKPVLGSNYLNQLRHFMLPHLSLISGNEKTAFNYTHCLRLLLIGNTVSIWEIKNSKVLEFLIANLKKPANQCHLIYLLDSLRLVLMNCPDLGINSIKLGIIDLLKQQCYDNQPSLVVRVFEKLALFIGGKQLHELCCLFHHKIKTEGFSEEAVKCLSTLLHYESSECLLEILEDGLIDHLEDFILRDQSPVAVGHIINALEKLATLSKTKLPQLYSCVVAKISSSCIIKVGLELGYETKMFAERLIQKHLSH